MAVTLNASTSSGLVQTADTSGTIEFQNNGTTRLTVGSSGVTIPTLNTATGVLATQNGMTGIPKAWVNFNGTGTVAIRGSFNVSSITDNGTGDYTVNFTTAMPNANYSAVTGIDSGSVCRISTFTTSSITATTFNTSFGAFDATIISLAIFSS